jgi:hypothetical protein
MSDPAETPLARAERHVAESERIVARQLASIEALEREGVLEEIVIARRALAKR